tara:strand:- start:193 stop:1203 length:1011 start_codon:yes stop_codon:yes gene_type:complete
MKKSSQLPEIVQALLDAKIYPDKPEKIGLAQTQMSFVFLTGSYVYKIKKPVNLGYLDYTTLQKRHFYCQREVKLNKRLCPETYLGVVPIVRKEGKILIGGQGETIEYAVKMLQLAQEKMMGTLLDNNQVSAAMVTRVAQKLAEFHKKAETSPTISTFGDLNTITQNTAENFSQTIQYIGTTISQEKHQRISDYANRFLKNNAPLFQKRLDGGKIKDCHGDLHAAHICFTDDICIYDCIEFNDRFRYGDIAAEVAFLAMDLDHYGQSDLSHSFVDAYITFSQDKELLKLLNFYKCYRAYIRGKVEGFKLNDPHISEEEKTKVLAVAREYLELAASYT